MLRGVEAMAVSGKRETAGSRVQVMSESASGVKQLRGSFEIGLKEMRKP